MEVMNSSELTQTDILVGQKSITRSFGVSDDPMLMSMLSTGFYQNPLRTMIQEVMFNAWDAHRMGNCQHRPIDVYINEISGLIIRDYGPGIDPGENDDNMHEIYCMYGGSTKRKMKNQTGGFGLGSKSPFAYTESFTVTSHFSGTKNMYLISRVSESNGGKPGMTSLVRVPTTETGLLVTVPLKAGDIDKAYRYVEDILFLSGIKAMIHFKDSADQFFDSESLTSGEYKIDEDRKGGRIYAVYGGVRYHIPTNEEYEHEFNFMKLLAKDRDVFVGFAPDTLSPLPNREGLNMGEKSKDNIKSNFEICIEKFQLIFEPLMKAVVKLVFETTKENGLQGGFALIKASKYGFYDSCGNDYNRNSHKMLLQIPTGTNKSVWDIGVTLALHQTKAMVDLLGREKYKTIFISEFISQYPECKDLAFAILKANLNEVFDIYENNFKAMNFVAEFYRYKFIREHVKFSQAMKKLFPEDDSLISGMRVYENDTWVYPVQDRAKANLSKTKYGLKGMKADDPRLVRGTSFTSLINLYNKSGNELEFLMMDKTVLITKTLAILKDTKFSAHIMKHRDITFKKFRYNDSITMPIPAYVIHERKGAYDKALEYFKNEGFNVIEGDEPIKKEYVPKKKEVPTYSLISPNNSTWQSSNKNDQFTDPTHFFYATKAELKYYGSSNKPSPDLVKWFLQKNPKTVTVGNTIVAQNLEKKGAIPIHKGFENWYDNVSQDKDRMTNIVRAAHISKRLSLNQEILSYPLMQLEMGMEPVDPKDADFWYESLGYNLLMSSEYSTILKLKEKVKSEINDLWLKDPERGNIEEMCKLPGIFNQYQISSLWSSTKDKDKPALIDKIIATMKLFK